MKAGKIFIWHHLSGGTVVQDTRRTGPKAHKIQTYDSSQSVIYCVQ